jgi:hypothetical protein
MKCPHLFILTVCVFSDQTLKFVLKSVLKFGICLLAEYEVSFSFFRSNIVKEAAWTVSNITAGNPDQIQLVIDAQILQPLIEVLVRVIITF